MQPVPKSKIGVLLVNLGTPNGTDYWNMRKYLSQFLSDKRVIEWPSIIWQPILQAIVLSVRPKKSGAAYDRVWFKETNESPLRHYTRLQAERLAEQLHDLNNDNTIIVDWAMRYGQPSISEVTAKLQQQGCDKITLFPLYPQYSATTTATVNDAFFDALKTKRVQPAIRTVPPYPDNPIYIDALAQSIDNHLATLDFTPDVLIASYHGIPQSYAKRGDIYPQDCAKTTNALRQRMGLGEDKLLMTFQSRFGPEEWLQPYSDKTIDELPAKGIKSIAVFNPGFVADCLETVDEIGHEAAESFHENGGINFSHIPCLNASDLGMKVIESLVRQELSGWVK
ncbi:ferrochelatase [Bartonella sp. HY329]|nr:MULTISPECIES: ferrochelatase [unclassified Bartonella]UXM96386.1 ferrochelatase [Bartonella sp. HY329]UXN10710.1 ferrochelatase [Bartonella sp. HY328]